VLIIRAAAPRAQRRRGPRPASERGAKVVKHRGVPLSAAGLLSLVVIPRIRNRGFLCTAAIQADFYRALRLPNNRASAPSSLPTESRISMTGWRSDKSAPEAPGQSRTHSAGSDPPARPRPGTNGRQRVCRAGSGSSLHSRAGVPATFA